MVNRIRNSKNSIIRSRVGMAVDRGKAGIRPNPPRLDRGWTIRIGRWTYTGIPV